MVEEKNVDERPVVLKVDHVPKCSACLQNRLPV